MTTEDQQQPEVVQPPFWRLAVDQFLAAGFQAGDVIPHAWFYEALGIPEPKPNTPYGVAEKIELQYMGGMVRVRNALEQDHQVYLNNVKGRGYQWVPPGEQTAVAMEKWQEEVKAATRRVSRSVVNVDHAALTQEQVKENHEAMAKLASFKVMRRRLANGSLKALEDKR